MTDPEFAALRATFPWTERVTGHPRQGGIVQVIDRYNREVPLFTITAFLKFITTRLDRPAATPAPTAAPTTPKE